MLILIDSLFIYVTTFKLNYDTIVIKAIKSSIDLNKVLQLLNFALGIVYNFIKLREQALFLI